MRIDARIEFDSHSAKAWLSRLERKQLPFATSKALNMTAIRAGNAVMNEMRKCFDRPTSFTLRSVYVKFGKKNNPTSEVGIKDYAGKGTPAAKYLRAEIEGGERDFKRSEGYLYQKGILKSGEYIVPGAGIKLDQYGNISKGQMTRILSGLKAFTEVGYLMNASGSRRSLAKGNGMRYVAFQPRGGNRPFAIYEKRGRSLIPILNILKRPPKYRKLFKFYETVIDAAQANIQKEFERAMEYALFTAK